MNTSVVARFLVPRIRDAMKISPVVFLNGIRQSGKSTLVQNMDIGGKRFPANYVTFDRPITLASAANAPEAFLESFPNQVIIDEVQLVPEIFRTLKIAVDDLRLKNKKQANGKYILTGSANILALPELSDALAGRMSVLTLYPFSAAEASGGKGNGVQRILNLDFAGLPRQKINLLDAIRIASFPELLNQKTALHAVWFDGFLTTLLQRDVRQLAALEKITVLPHLLRILASRSGGLTNEADIAREAGLNAVTGKFYHDILKMMFLSFDLPPWHKNIGKRLVKSAKGYLTDTLMLCHILGLNLEDLYRNKPDLFGHVLENYIATELVKQLSYHPSRAALYHFRTSDGKEIDFILENPDGSVVAIEVKRKETVTINDFRGIQLFATLSPKLFRGGIVLYSGKEVFPFGKDLWAVPMHILWA